MHGPVEITVEGTVHRAKVLGVRRERRALGGYEAVSVRTDRGDVQCRYYAAKAPRAAVVLLVGVGGGYWGPALLLYPLLAVSLRRSRVSVLRVRYRRRTDLADSTMDAVVGASFLLDEGAPALGVVGYSFGGAVAVQAAANCPAFRTVVTLATQSYGAGVVSALQKATSVLVIHGRRDRRLPLECSELVFRAARGAKRLVILDRAGHFLGWGAIRAYREVSRWLRSELLRSR